MPLYIDPNRPIFSPDQFHLEMNGAHTPSYTDGKDETAPLYLKMERLYQREVTISVSDPKSPKGLRGIEQGSVGDGQVRVSDRLQKLVLQEIHQPSPSGLSSAQKGKEGLERFGKDAPVDVLDMIFRQDLMGLDPIDGSSLRNAINSITTTCRSWRNTFYLATTSEAIPALRSLERAGLIEGDIENMGPVAKWGLVIRTWEKLQPYFLKDPENAKKSPLALMRSMEALERAKVCMDEALVAFCEYLPEDIILPAIYFETSLGEKAALLRMELAESKEVALLEELNIVEKGLEFIPPEIKYFVSLGIVDFSNNKIRAIPAELCRLSALKHADFAHNQITAIPHEIVRSVLQGLNLAFNKITVVPREIGAHPSLARLSLAHNKINAIPKELFSLKEAYIAANPVSQVEITF